MDNQKYYWLLGGLLLLIAAMAYAIFTMQTNQKNSINQKGIYETENNQPIYQNANTPSGNIATIENESLEDLLKKSFATKYRKSVKEITIKLEQVTAGHARGIIEFTPGGAGNTGMFLAALVDNFWKIVVDGNGAYACSSVEKYGFPATMIFDCYDGKK